MSSSRLLVLVFCASRALAAGDGFLVGAGIESDSEDGIRGSLVGGVGLGEKTWLSGGVSKSSVELPTGRDIDTLFGDVELDHWFDPLGIRLGVSYWGDPDILDSNDWRASLYWRGNKVTLSGDYEFRDFDFTVPSLDLLTTREVTFDADGIGASAQVRFTDDFSVRIEGIRYDYSVDFIPDENRDVISLFSVSRLSLINSLIDSRASLEFAIDRGLQRWEIEFATWEGEIDRSRTKSLTVRYLLPMAGKSDIEFGLGHDDSDLYGDVTFFSVFVFFYGGT